MVIKINKILLQLYLLLLFPFLTYADGLNDDFEAYSRISSTINLGPVLTKGIITPDGKNSSSTDKSLITWGLIAGAETSLFITDRIAFEFFMAGSLCPINSSLYSSTTTTGSNNPLMIYIPVGVGLNFHPFPFGGIDPYIGFGGEYDCIFSTSGSVIPENAFTWFGKFGVSLIKSNN